MNALPDIVVLDFCEWLNRRLKYTDGERALTLDILVGNGNNRHQLEYYAQEYLESNQTGCPLKNMVLSFFESDEFSDVLHRSDCCHFSRKCSFDSNNIEDLYDCLHCYKIYQAFRHFVKNYQKKDNLFDTRGITPKHLADYTRWVFLYGDNDCSVKQKPPMLQLMTNSSIELSEELNFFEWLERHIECATDVRKMPSDVFERYVDEYIDECNKTATDKKHLLKSYRQTGWEELLESFQVLIKIKERKNSNFPEILSRYFSKYAKYKCIILPLSDSDSQRIYHTVISESWDDLNSCSGDYLDIYYSEADNGKSGFDIAKRINSLPKNLTLQAPCIIVWEHSMKDAKSVSIYRLNSIQIVELIKSIVQNIENGKCFSIIIKEARNKVKELQNENKNVSNYYAPVITGNGNVVGDNNAVGTGNVSGSSNLITGNAVGANSDELLSKALEEFETAISAIHNSAELNEDMKSQLIDIIKTAKSGVFERSDEKQQKAKTAFGYVKSFLTRIAPCLLETFANIATIATFFGIVS